MAPFFMAQLTLGTFSFLLSCTFLLFFLFSDLSPQNLNPIYITSSQLLAVGVFIYQSQLTWGGAESQELVQILGLGGSHLALE